MRTMLKSKIHRAVVTDSNINYEGSITIDPELLQTADIYVGEKVDIYNITNGERFSTYAISGKKGEITLNGAAARKVQPEDIIIIASYVLLEDKDALNYKAKVIYLDKNNKIKSNLKAL